MEIVRTIFSIILEMSLIATAIGYVTLMVKRLLKNKISPKWLNILWSIFLVTLINPIKIQSNFSIYNILNSEGIVNKRRIIIEEALDKHTNMSYLDLEGQEVIGEVLAGKKLNFFALDKFGIDKIYIILNVIAISYFSIVTIKILISLLTNINIQKQIKRKFESNRLEKILRISKEKLDFDRNIFIAKQNIISTPSVYGVIKPKLLLSEEILELSDEEIKMILLHELAHLKKGDTVLNNLLQCLKIIYWFNPLIIFLLNKVKKDMELSNDEEIISTLETDSINTYCKTLIKVSIMSNEKQSITIGIASKARDLEERIKMIKAKDNFIKNKMLIILIITVLCLGITVSLATSKVTNLEDNKIVSNDSTANIISNKNNGLKDITYPVEGDFKISATYSSRIHPITKETMIHNGIDITKENILGERVLAVVRGIVEYTGFDSQYGNVVEIKHIDEETDEILYTFYAHLSEIKVKVGEHVDKGQEIGSVGNTGMATGPHLHFEIRDENKKHIDPNKYLEF